MSQPTRDALQALFPGLDSATLDASHERLQRYLQIAIDVSLTIDDSLTESSDGGSVNPGQVEPRTFKNTG